VDESVIEGGLDVANTEAVFSVLAGSNVGWSVVGNGLFLDGGFTSVGSFLCFGL
jgi:hypothetical protein